MTDLAAHLLDEVLPALPVRQWVLTVPFPLRLRMACDADFSSAVRRAFGDAMQRVIEDELRARLGSAAPHRRDPSGRRIATGAVPVVQRFGSGLNLHVHLHTLVLDGAFVGDPERGVRFVDTGLASGVRRPSPSPPWPTLHRRSSPPACAATSPPS